MSKRNRKQWKNRKRNHKYNGNQNWNGSKDSTTTQKSEQVKPNTDKVEGATTHTSRDNDVSWWNNLGQVSKDSASYSFYNQMGSKIYGITSWEKPISMPGLMVLNYMPSIGAVSSSTDPINSAARWLYDKINYKNSRNFNYDVPDLMMYVLSMASLYSYHAYIKRIIGVINTYSTVNRYIPAALVEAMGCDYGEVVTQLPYLRNVANTIARRVNMMAVPAGIPYFDRIVWMNTNVYMDDPTVKAGLYLFKPIGFWRFEEMTSSTGSQLVLDKTIMGKDKLDARALMEYGQKLIDPILASQDMAHMSSDIMKACEGKIIQLGDVTEDYAIAPVYSPEVLTQINNAVTANGIEAMSTIKITQDPNTNFIQSNLKLPAGSANLHFAGLGHIINMPMDEPTPDDMLVATRLIPVFDQEGNLVSCGTEIVTSIQVYKYAIDNAGNWVLKNSTLYTPCVYNRTAETVGYDAYASLCDYNKFGSAPTMMNTIYNTGTKTYSDPVVFSDLQNYTLIHDADVKTLHEAALLSVFTILN